MKGLQVFAIRHTSKGSAKLSQLPAVSSWRVSTFRPDRLTVFGAGRGWGWWWHRREDPRRHELLPGGIHTRDGHYLAEI